MNELQHAGNSDNRLDEIVNKYSDMIYRIALVRTKNQVFADDVVGEVFLRLVRHIHKLNEDEHVKAWLIRVTVNYSKTYMTKRQRESTQIFDDIPAFSQESYSEIYQLVLSLPDKYKTAIHLFYYEDLTIKEISQILKQSESATKMQLKRAKELLKEILEEDGHYES